MAIVHGDALAVDFGDARQMRRVGNVFQGVKLASDSLGKADSAK
ncbi:MAG TPA: hypothetical protein VFS95_00065 [Telluria sp.]|nr:hypothetical protein [Telluria sp.]